MNLQKGKSDEKNLSQQDLHYEVQAGTYLAEQKKQYQTQFKERRI